MTVQRIEVKLEIGGQKVDYITSGNLETLTDETIKERFIRDHNIGKKQGDVKVLSKMETGKIGL